MKTAFNNQKYVEIQSQKIKERISKNDKLYMEFGGKLFDDNHAARILPGFEPDTKIKMLQELKDISEIIICINAKDIERNKIRADYGITYDIEVLRLIDAFKSLDLTVNSVVVTMFKGQQGAKKFKSKLESRGIKTYIHTPTQGYPTNVDVIVSEEGYGQNEYIKTTKPLVVVTAPGPSSGKLGTCLSQLYHEHKNGVKAGYSKFETFPVWNLPLKHPVNAAYEAATADLKDKNMIDSFHLEKYGEKTINYNRDLEVFPVLRSILHKITGENIYNSPTDMGVNMVGFCIDNDEEVIKASKKEIIRRYYKAICDAKTGNSDEETANTIKLLINELEIDEDTLFPTMKAARDKHKLENLPVIAIKLPNNKIITGKKTELLSPASALIINAIKDLANIKDEVHLLSPLVLKQIRKLKKYQGSKELTLSLQEVLIALSITSSTNPIVEEALSKLKLLKNSEAHASYILYNGDLSSLRKLNINLTCDPNFYNNNLYTNE